MLNDRDFMRYSRQLLLEEFGLEAQQMLSQSRVLVVGLGGLGSPAALYLAAAGVGTLWLADDDALHISNLQRQILFRDADAGANKAARAQQHLQALNPRIRCHTLVQHMDSTALHHHVPAVDLVLDCSDNMQTRHAINAACVIHATPLISASAVGFGGQLMVLTPPYHHGCFRCLWPEDNEPERNCRTAGILGPVVGVMGTLQALEAIRLLTGQRSPLDGKLRLFDGRQQAWRTLTLARTPACPVCGGADAHHRK
ncbi:HesA/MoeB/ThiF family protein [Pantoea sp. 1.19]|uniref:HesA/MoeB/ThiF family protein n=1 Tax=Pantoea sp. 1.19 TaxID=1925589 RepID=UPI000948E833|nr:HesA/MoeB/ThiF family protein [Pantoea sp. 1.19]